MSIARPDGSSALIVEALVADATAAVVLTSRNAQGAHMAAPRRCRAGPGLPRDVYDARRFAAGLLKVGNVLLLSNAKINMFQGPPRLALDRSGTMQLAAEGTEVEPQARAAAAAAGVLANSALTRGTLVQTALNMSLIEYDLVTA